MVRPSAILRSISRLLGLRRRGLAGLRPEALLLQEAEVVAPIGPGMTGRVELRRGAAAAEFRARAQDPAQAFERGARVRLIDYREESFLVEPADEEHLVR